MKNILIINDDMHIANVLEKVFTKEGYCVYRAYSEKEISFSGSGSKPALVLTDLMFQGNGEEALSHIKEIPIIVFNEKDDDCITGQDCVLVFDDVMLNTVTHIVTVCEKRIKLTRTEYALLKLLMQNPGKVIKKSLMLELIVEDTPDCTEISLKVHVSNLRRKIREISGRDYIEAVWGVGFKLRAE